MESMNPDTTYSTGRVQPVVSSKISYPLARSGQTLTQVLEPIVMVVSSPNQRNKENKKYLELKEKVKKEFNYIKMRYKDRNTHMDKKCPKCNQRVRLPLKKGKHTVKCPNCKNKFEVKCKRDEKIKVEIIK